MENDLLGFCKQPYPPTVKCRECNDSGYIDKDTLDDFLEWAEHYYMFLDGRYVPPVTGDNSRLRWMIKAYRWWQHYGEVVCACNDFPYEDKAT